MFEFMKDSNKAYRGPKEVISISLDSDLIKYLDDLSQKTGLDRSKIINYCLRGSENLFASLNNQIQLSKMLGFRSPNKMRRAMKRAAEKAEKKNR